MESSVILKVEQLKFVALRLLFYLINRKSIRELVTYFRARVVKKGEKEVRKKGEREKSKNREKIQKIERRHD